MKKEFSLEEQQGSVLVDANDDIGMNVLQLHFSTYFRKVFVRMYSASSLETTIFCQTRQFFRSTFLSSWLTPYFSTLMGGNRGHVLPPIRV